MTRRSEGAASLRWVAAAAVGVSLWRIASLLRPTSLISIPDGLRLALALLGGVFLFCGLWAWWRRPGTLTSVFLLYGLGGAIHWGGAVGSSRPGIELTLLLIYLAASAMSEAALLHLALIYPAGKQLATWVRTALYLPAGSALALAVVSGLTPRPVLEASLGVILMIANAFSFVAAGVFIIRLFRCDAMTRRAARLPLIVGGLVVGDGIALVGDAGLLFGAPEAWNLATGIIPICLAIALVSQTVDRPAT